ncbi:nicotinamidase-related amidase [Geomicrobium halophilum]|uniref:Nicotinamidase-related amidase n=1 Tax=Geomicrobium halophilum TaxID=549000 RepID=A0A841Q1D8_9BACL|nr:isochorismatase family cysteine hydrolase [Geomicrobium halophilum]MBB6451535.1 nicotinamidase-related amidase [Geomicrobium halophilum]
MAETPPHIHRKSDTALLLIDFINNLDFPEGEALRPHGEKAAIQAQRLKTRAKNQSVPVIYINDNYGRWQSNFQQIVEFCTSPQSKGKEMSKTVLPEADDYFVLKPQFSAFFETPLELLLEYLGVKRLILTGVAGDKCIHFSANDAYMRGFELYVPEDCLASDEKSNNIQALSLMKGVLGADTTPSSRLEFPLDK